MKNYSYLETTIGFIFLRDWAEVVASDIIYNEEPSPSYYCIKKIQSIILQSMTPIKG
jgi:hypothetical protein